MCAFVFTYAKCWFYHEEVQISSEGELHSFSDYLSSDIVKTSKIHIHKVRIKEETHPNLKQPTNWLMVTDFQCRMRSVHNLFDSFTLPQHPVTPCRDSTLLTENKICI